MPERTKGDDCLTTFLAGLVGIVMFGSLLIWVLSVIFG